MKDKVFFSKETAVLLAFEGFVWGYKHYGIPAKCCMNNCNTTVPLLAVIKEDEYILCCVFCEERLNDQGWKTWE